MKKQCTNVGSEVSEASVITSGVPQGSILGPFFFIIYVNDLFNWMNSESIDINVYADDTIITSRGKTLEDSEAILKEYIEILNV